MDQSVSISPSAERELFARAMLSPRTSTRVDFMARFGVEWLDPTADRKLLERLLTFPLHIFRVGNRPRRLARELGRGRLPRACGYAAQAATVHRALDAGLFAAALESGQGFEPVARTGSNHNAAAARARNAVPTSSLFESVADMRRISSAH